MRSAGPGGHGRRVLGTRRHRHAGHRGGRPLSHGQLASVPALHQHELEKHEGQEHPDRAEELAHE